MIKKTLTTLLLVATSTLMVAESQAKPTLNGPHNDLNCEAMWKVGAPFVYNEILTRKRMLGKVKGVTSYRNRIYEDHEAGSVGRKTYDVLIKAADEGASVDKLVQTGIKLCKTSIISPIEYNSEAP